MYTNFYKSWTLSMNRPAVSRPLRWPGTWGPKGLAGAFRRPAQGLRRPPKAPCTLKGVF